jgi:hypothetical protein
MDASRLIDVLEQTSTSEEIGAEQTCGDGLYIDYMARIGETWFPVETIPGISSDDIGKI